MDKKRIGYGVIGGVLVLAGLALCPGKKEKLEQPTQIVPLQQTQPVQKIEIPQRQLYVVKKGDYLSGIVYNELGLRGRNIYTKCLDIQTKNNLGSKRDISKVVNGKLVPGKDGFVDLLYPEEKLDLY